MSIDKRTLHKRDYDSNVNERQMQTIEEKVDTSKALNANIRPIYDEEPMAVVQTTAEINVFATRQQHTEQPEFNNEGGVDQNVEHNAHNKSNPSISSNDINVKLSKEFLVKLRKNTYNGTHNEDVVDHMAMVLELVDLIYIPGVDSHQLRMKVFPLSLADDAK
ncbi:hypothetical protein Tco_0933168 [Tanacetum coccineum]